MSNTHTPGRHLVKSASLLPQDKHLRASREIWVLLDDFLAADVKVWKIN